MGKRRLGLGEHAMFREARASDCFCFESIFNDFDLGVEGELGKYVDDPK